jgi:hypothetical protein
MLHHLAPRAIAASAFALASGPALASLTLLPSGPQQGVNNVNNLVTNGSFEQGAPSPDGSNYFWATGTTQGMNPFAVPPGWTSQGQSNTYAYWGNDGPGPARLSLSDKLPDGRNALYFGNATTTVDQTPTFNPNGTISFPGTPTFTPLFGGPCTLKQTIPTHTNIAPAYLLSFWASGEAVLNAIGDGLFGLRVTNVLPGDPIQFLTTPGGASALGGSIRYEFQFTPINPLAPVDIEFINWGHLALPGEGSLGNGLFRTELVLDDVIVNPIIPAPSAATLFALAGLAARRRRR